MNTAYGALKHHFNKLLMGGYQSNNGLEPIRDVYEKAFDIKINLFDVYQTQIRDSHNPVGAICTLLGPEPESEDEKDIPTGILWEEQTNGLISVNTFSDEILKGINEDTARWYISRVYKSMLDVVQYDQFYKSDMIARNNPYMTFVKCVPLYFTFHHVAECIPRMYNRDIFRDLIEKYTYAGDTTELILSSLENSSYTEDVTQIYSIVSAKGKADLLC